MKDNLPPSHPGVHVRMGLDALDLTAAEAARLLGCSRAYLGDVIHGRRDLSTDMCFKISGLLGSTPAFWAALQTQYDLKRAQRNRVLMGSVRRIRAGLRAYQKKHPETA
jgi:antitoxin HigA-1